MQFIFLEQVDSTNLEAHRLREHGQNLPFWLSARQQTHGRGRQGQTWYSDTGNLFCTGCFAYSGDVQQAAHYSFVSALAVAQTLAHFIPAQNIKLKWPNDVLVDGAKICGILLEGGDSCLRVGIGINIVSHPSETPYPATHLLAHIPVNDLAAPEAMMIEASCLLPLLAERFERERERLINKGFAPVRQAWLDWALPMPCRVKVRSGGHIRTGQALTLGRNGELEFLSETGQIELICAGEVFFPGSGDEHAIGY